MKKFDKFLAVTALLAGIWILDKAIGQNILPVSAVKLTDMLESLYVDVVSLVSRNRLATTTTIEGGTDGTVIGNVADRLKVTPQATPPIDTIHRVFFLENNLGEIQMNVDGSITPVVYSYDAVGIQYLDYLCMLVIDSGTMGGEDYGAIANGLTNGTIIEIKANGSTYTFSNLLNNFGINSTFETVFAPGTSSGWLDNNDIFYGCQRFSPAISLKQTTGDFIRATVRDELDSLQGHLVSFKLWEVP